MAVLAVDPSSTRSRGSILGDKTRMAQLAVDEHAFVRPSPSAGTLGGVARATRETIVLMEAAGYDIVLVETVGVGQSEVTVAGMVDTFLLLTIARTGDSLQGIKKGILELADVVAVNKADGGAERDARAAARELAGALRMMAPGARGLAAAGAGLQRAHRRRAGRGVGGRREAPGHPGRGRGAGAQAGRAAGGLDVGDGPRPAAGPAAHRPRGARAAAGAGAGACAPGSSPRPWPRRPCSTCWGSTRV